MNFLFQILAKQEGGVGARRRYTYLNKLMVFISLHSHISFIAPTLHTDIFTFCITVFNTIHKTRRRQDQNKVQQDYKTAADTT